MNRQSCTNQGAIMKNCYVLDVEKFIADNCHSPMNWPRVCHTDPSGSLRTRLFVSGDLVVDLPIRLAARVTPQFVSRWRNGEAPGCDWEVGKPSLGGLVGNAAPLAARLGCDVHIAAIVPLPTPGPIGAFLESNRFDSRHVVVCPGPAPVAVELQFTDRCVKIVHPGVSAFATPPVPSNLGEAFDVVLVDSGPRAGRHDRLQALVKSCRWGHRDVAVGIIGRADMSAAEMELLSRENCWMFLSEAEARQAADGAVGNGSRHTLAEAMAGLKQRMPAVRLVVATRERGIWSMNGAPEPKLFASPRISCDGAGHVLSVCTLLSSLKGKSDDDAIRSGVDAAADHFGARPLPAVAAGADSPVFV
jgi:hypothetical protein